MLSVVTHRSLSFCVYLLFVCVSCALGRNITVVITTALGSVPLLRTGMCAVRVLIRYHICLRTPLTAKQAGRHSLQQAQLHRPMLLLVPLVSSSISDATKVGHGEKCDPSASAACGLGLSCLCQDDYEAAHRQARKSEASADETVPYIASDFPDLGQGLPGLTTTGKSYYASEFRDILRSRMLADGRRLGEEARNRNCFCAPSEPALDLRAAPVFQSNFPHGYGIANPVNGDTYGALFNPNWENCGHCAPTISNPS